MDPRTSRSLAVEGTRAGVIARNGPDRFREGECGNERKIPLEIIAFDVAGLLRACPARRASRKMLPAGTQWVTRMLPSGNLYRNWKPGSGSRLRTGAGPGHTHGSLFQGLAPLPDQGHAAEGCGHDKAVEACWRMSPTPSRSARSTATCLGISDLFRDSCGTGMCRQNQSPAVIDFAREPKTAFFGSRTLTIQG